MTDAGMFDVIIGKLMLLVKDNVIGVCVMTCIIALIGHLDGGGASTFCIVVPAMLPVYKKMHMRPATLLRIAVISMGVLNLMPWAGPTMRAATVLGIEAGSLWQTLLPTIASLNILHSFFPVRFRTFALCFFLFRAFKSCKYLDGSCKDKSLFLVIQMSFLT